MIRYIPIAVYHDTEDINNLFPSGSLKGDEADIIVKRYLAGNGNPRKIDHADDEAIWTEKEVREDIANGNFLLTTNGKYGVRFTRGDSAALKRYGNDQAGFYIDIYRELDQGIELATRILNFVMPYIPEHIKDECLNIIYKKN